MILGLLNAVFFIIAIFMLPGKTLSALKAVSTVFGIKRA
jgi:hypothetical protein